MTRGYSAVVSLSIGFAVACTVMAELGVPVLWCTPQAMKKYLTGVASPSDARIRRCVNVRYPEMAALGSRFNKGSVQHPYEAVGAVSTVCATEHVRCFLGRVYP